MKLVPGLSRGLCTMPKTKRKSSRSQSEKQAILKEYQEAKKIADTPETQSFLATAIEQFGGEINPNSFAFVLTQMRLQGLKGFPYVHTRTYRHWRESGRQVRKGEKSHLHSVTWINSKSNQEKGEVEGEGRAYPKITNLFHISQTDPIE